MLGEGNLVKEPQRADVWSTLGGVPPQNPPTLIRQGGGERVLSPAFT